MQIYKKILVPLDCSEVDGPILQHVTALARQNSAQVILLHVIHSHTLDQDRALREKALTAMQFYSAEMEEQGINVQSRTRNGEPEDEILKEIEAGSYDLVAMATHGHTFWGDILFGSVSDRLKHEITIPLLLLKCDK